MWKSRHLFLELIRLKGKLKINTSESGKDIIFSRNKSSMNCIPNSIFVCFRLMKLLECVDELDNGKPKY